MKLIISLSFVFIFGSFLGLIVASAIDPCIWGENEPRLTISKCYAVRGLGPVQEVSCDRLDAARAVWHRFWCRKIKYRP